MELYLKQKKLKGSLNRILSINWNISILLCFFVLLPYTATIGQQNNPFDLVPRIDVSKLDDSTTIANQNPFDITAPPLDRDVFTPTPYVIENADRNVDNDKQLSRFLFLVLSFDMILLTILAILFSGYFARIFDAFQSENLMAQLYRERATGFSFPFIILYLIFFINAGIFLFLALDYFDINIAMGNFPLLLTCIGLITLVYLGRHIFLSIMANILPVEKQVRLYSFMINIFNIITGLALIPINLFIGFGPELSTGFFVYLGFIVFTLIFIFRSLRSLAIANRLLTMYLFHFLLYICTTEIVPLVIIFKLIRDQTMN